MQLEKDVQKKLHQGLLEMRMTEEKLIEIYAAGKVPGHIHSGMGQEAPMWACCLPVSRGTM